jgi:hypothetical protein
MARFVRLAVAHIEVLFSFGRAVGSLGEIPWMLLFLWLGEHHTSLDVSLSPFPRLWQKRRSEAWAAVPQFDIVVLRLTCT